MPRPLSAGEMIAQLDFVPTDDPLHWAELVLIFRAPASKRHPPQPAPTKLSTDSDPQSDLELVHRPEVGVCTVEADCRHQTAPSEDVQRPAPVSPGRCSYECCRTRREKTGIPLR